MADNIARILALIDQAEELPPGPTKIALLEQAVRIADISGDMEWQFCARQSLIGGAFLSGDADKLLVALTWCLAKDDQYHDPDNRDLLLWQCKHALSYIAGFPDISRAQIDQIRTDIVGRYQQHGASLRPIWQFACSNALAMGDFDAAHEFHARIAREPQDWFSEGPQWELCFEVEYLLDTEQIDQALTKVQPVLDDRVPSDETYHWHAVALLPHLIRRGDLEQARACHLRAYPRIRHNAKYTAHIGVHMVFLATTGNFSKVATLLESHLEWALAERVPELQMMFYRGAWYAMLELAKNGRDQLSLQLPHSFELAPAPQDTRTLATWFEARTRELTARFDSRNGNDHQSRMLDATMELAEFACDFPI